MGSMPPTAILYSIPGVKHVHCQASMKEYTSNKEECRRMMLLKDFDGTEEFGTSRSDSEVLCSCCDVHV
jgi:hypothetical protein